MISMISCNFLLASFGGSSSTVRFHPLGVLSHDMTLPVSIVYANARSGPKQTRCPCCVLGLTAIRGLLTSACRDSIVMSLPSVSSDTSKRRPSSHTTDLLASRRLLYSGFLVPVTSVSSRCWMPCRHHCPARCHVDSKRDLFASFCPI